MSQVLIFMAGVLEGGIIALLWMIVRWELEAQERQDLDKRRKIEEASFAGCLPPKGTAPPEGGADPAV